jgi:hypothetical protein
VSGTVHRITGMGQIEGGLEEGLEETLTVHELRLPISSARCMLHKSTESGHNLTLWHITP